MTSDAQFKIDIKTTADTAALEKSIAILTRARDIARQAGQDTSLYDAAIQRNKDSLNEAAHAAETAGQKTSEAAEHSTLSHHHLAHAIRAVGAEFGGAGELGMLAYGGQLAAIGLLLTAVDAWKKKIKEAAKAQEALAAQIVAVSDAATKAMQDSTTAASASINQLAIEQGKLNAAYAAGDTAMQNRLKLYGEEVDGVLKVQEAKEKAYEAELDQKVALGAMSKETAEGLKAEQHLNLDIARAHGDERKLNEEITERQSELLRAKDRLNGADQKARDDSLAAEKPLAGQAAASAENAAQQAKRTLHIKYQMNQGTDYETQGNFSGTKEDAEKRVAEATLQKKELVRGGNLIEAGQRQDEINALTAAIAAEDHRNERFKQKAELDKEALERQKGITAQAEAQLQKDQELARSGQARIDLLEKELELHRKINAAVQEQTQAAANTRAHTASAEETRTVAAGRGSTAENAEIGDQAAQDHYAREGGAQAFQDIGNLHQQVFAARSAVHSGHGDAHALNDYHNEVLGLIRDVHTSAAQRVDLDGLRRQVEQLQSQVHNSR